MVQKGRYGKHKPKKLTLELARQIENLYNAGNYTQVQLGLMFGVTQNMVSKITTKRYWK